MGDDSRSDQLAIRPLQYVPSLALEFQYFVLSGQFFNVGLLEVIPE